MFCVFRCLGLNLRMFIRKKRNASGSITVQILHKYKGKNHHIKTIGTSNEPEEVDFLYLEAQKCLPGLFNQLSIFAEQENPKIQLIKELNNDDIRVCGPYLVFGKIFSSLGFDQIPDTLFQDLVISRITHPGSKLQLAEFLHKNGKQTLSVDGIYRFLDKLTNRHKHQIESISFAHTKKLLGGQIGAIFYDMTTIYFESSKPDEFRMTGFSKEGKHQHPQIFLGLLVGENGYPIGYDIFEGNIYEGHTLIPMIESFEKRFKLDKPVVIADSGLLSKKNIESLKAKNYTFILGARIKNESKNIISKIEKLNLENGKVAEIEKEDSTRLIISYTDKRALKDKSNRERGLKRLEKSLNSGKLTKSNINNRGYNKYLQMTGHVDIKIDYDRFKLDSKWDGLKGYVTNTKLSSDEIIKHYSNLWKIEKAFRISKTDLKIRPIYHRLRDRIEAHICISFVAYVLYKELDRVLTKHKSNMSINKAIEEINKMYEIQIKDNNNNKTVIQLNNNIHQQKITDIINQEF